MANTCLKISANLKHSKYKLFNFFLINLQAGCDRMAADCAVELKDKNVTMVSLWPGPVK